MPAHPQDSNKPRCCPISNKGLHAGPAVHAKARATVLPHNTLRMSLLIQPTILPTFLLAVFEAEMKRQSSAVRASASARKITCLKCMLARESRAGWYTVGRRCVQAGLRRGVFCGVVVWYLLPLPHKHPSNVRKIPHVRLHIHSYRTCAATVKT